MRRFTLVALLALTAGCTTMDLGTTFSRPDASVVEISRDEWECRRDVADQPSTDTAWIGGVVDAFRVYEEADDRDRLLADCMSSRGYRVERPDVWYRPLMPHWD